MLLIAGIGISLQTFAQRGFPFDNEIRAFKHQDSLNFPQPGGILFVGSSSIRAWNDLEQRFAGKPIIRRGVGGCELSQLVKYYTPYIVFPYRPAKIFIYAGENDIAAGKSAKTVQESFITLWKMINRKLPDTEIDFMSIKLSPSRARYYNEVNLANALIKGYLTGKPHSNYIDVNTVLLNKKTSFPDSSLFRPDYLHLNPKGYDRWEKVLKKYVNKKAA